ncbi:MAG: TonB-dependent receptor [Hyphomonadaceae bacterium]
MRVILCVAAATAMTDAALAQEPPGEGARQPEVVIVTGVGPARTTDELIGNTTALTSGEIAEKLDGGLGDTLSSLPGVSSTSFGPGASRPIIRGLGAERVQVLTNGIGVIDASAASPDHAVNADPLGAERIEILRGPASLAYGGGASGGVVNVIDGLIVESLPDQPFKAMAYGALSSADDGRQIAGRVTGTMGQFVGVVSGNYRKSSDVDIPGFAYSDARRAAEIEDGADPADFARDQLPNSFVDDSSLSAGLSWVGDRAFLGGAVRQADNKYGIVAEETAFIDMQQTRYDLRGGLRFDDAWLKSVTLSGSKADYEHTEFEAPGEPGTLFKSNGWEGRLEAEHAPIGGVSGSFGVQAFDKDFAAIGEDSLIGPTNTKQTGLFVYEVYDAGDWGLEGGLRYDQVDVDNIDFGKRSFEPLNASFGAHMHVGDNIFLGASIARTERAPTDIELFADGPHPATAQYEVGDDTLGIEKGVSGELNARWEGVSTNLQASLYRYDFDSFIYLRDTGAVEAGEEEDLPVFQYTQAGATFDGFEITGDTDLGAAIGADWSLDGSMDFVRAKLKAGGDLPRIPPMSATLGLTGQFELVKTRLEAEYGASQDHTAAFETETPEYLVLNAGISYDMTEHLRLMLDLRNLTDEEVRVAASPLKDIAPLPGRNVRIALRAEF